MTKEDEELPEKQEQDPEGSVLHQQAEDAREEGRYEEGVLLAQKAFSAYTTEENTRKAAEALCSGTLALRLRSQFEDLTYLDLAFYQAEAAVAVARTIEQYDKTALALPFFTRGKVYDDMGEYQEATRDYQAALVALQSPTPIPNEHNNLETIADITTHRAIAAYRADPTEGTRKEAERQIHALEQTPFPKDRGYQAAVWSSGARIRFAQAIFHQFPQEAERQLDKADTVIQTNISVYPNLAIRQRQVTKARQGFKQIT